MPTYHPYPSAHQRHLAQRISRYERRTTRARAQRTRTIIYIACHLPPVAILLACAFYAVYYIAPYALAVRLALR